MEKEENKIYNHPGKTLKYLLEHGEYKVNYRFNMQSLGIFQGRLLKIINGEKPLSVRDCIILGNQAKFNWKYWLTQQRLYDEQQREQIKNEQE